MAVRGFFYNATDLNDKEHMYNGQDMNEDKAPFYKEGVAYGHLQVTADGESMAWWTAAPGQGTHTSICTPYTIRHR